MKGEKLQDAIGMVDDELIKDADMVHKKKKSGGWLKYMSGTAALLALVLSVGIVFLRGSGDKKESTGAKSSVEEMGTELKDQAVSQVYVIEKCTYPTMASYPKEGNSTYAEDYEKWSDDRQALKEAYKNMSINQDKFLSNSIREMLTGTDGENVAYSPINVYMALGMLAEITDGNSRKQVLDALGVDDIETLRKEADAIWKANYCDDGAVSTILASSLWLNEDIDFNEKTMKTLASTYYASSYQGRMGSDEFNQELRTWMNEQTRGLLKGQIDNVEMNPNTVMTLAGTIYYSARWTDEFYGAAMRKFYGSDTEALCSYMEQSDTRTYYWGENFSTVAQHLEGSGDMWFILPDEGVSVDELLADEQAMEFILSTEKWKWENSNTLRVNLSVPKFDISSQINLKDRMMALGITDVFDSSIANFTPMTDDIDSIVLSGASHGVRVKIDEEGCEAAAYTVMMTGSGAIAPDEEMDFVVNRPFVFVITSDVGMPLFVGVVNNM